MKNFFLFSLFLLLPFFGCNNETPTSPQETSSEVSSPKANQNSEIQPQQQSIIISQPWDWANKGGKIITQKEANTLTNYYTYKIGTVQNIPISKTLLENALAGRGVAGIIFYFAKKPTGEFTVVSIPADIYGKRIVTSTVIGCENIFISYAHAQDLTSNFSYKIGGVTGRMFSKDFIKTMLGNANTLYLHCAKDSAGNLTFVLTNTPTTQNGTEPGDTGFPPPKE